MPLSHGHCKDIANFNAANAVANSYANANANAEAAQWLTAQDGWQQQLQWRAATRLRWMAATVMGNGGAMGGGMAE